MFRLSVLGFLTLFILAAPLNKPASSTQNAIVSDRVVQKVVPQDISFQEKGAVHGVTVDGCEFSSTGWEASDGAVVYLQIYYCRSPANVQAALNRLTNEASKNPEMILWTHGEEIYVVESESFGHALMFKKKYPKV